MALWICTACTCRYSVGAPRCPQCNGTDHVEEGQELMPKITVHGGPSIAGASVTGGSWSNEGDPDAWPEPTAEGGEEPTPEDSTSDGAEPEAAPEPGYEDWTVEQLKEQLGERGLSKTGNKGELVARLREDDHTDEAPETRVHAEPAAGSGEAGNLS